ncbi:hypothetical protein [Salibacterium halotolerans]|uniref:Uncharacterized protein n=1 Tax=Salibacterium halotolerans TaxID=1884432 RepID=A0A1I5TG26_9BACI|nr:hypothetical protein [Salibacterium halotolerans]SFP81975.1 hypothetical protein SAMN05518683_110150 [Salibacterium halotolerans]
MLDLSGIDTSIIDEMAWKLASLLLMMLLTGIIAAVFLRACKVPYGITRGISSIATLVAAYYWFQMLT